MHNMYERSASKVNHEVKVLSVHEHISCSVHTLSWNFNVNGEGRVHVAIVIVMQWMPVHS